MFLFNFNFCCSGQFFIPCLSFPDQLPGYYTGGSTPLQINSLDIISMWIHPLYRSTSLDIIQVEQPPYRSTPWILYRGWHALLVPLRKEYTMAPFWNAVTVPFHSWIPSTLWASSGPGNDLYLNTLYLLIPWHHQYYELPPSLVMTYI